MLKLTALNLDGVRHGQNAEIQAMRAIAVLMAVFSHINPLVPGGTEVYGIIAQYITGWAGVDLFFCISGYVISKSFVESFDQYRLKGKWHLAAQAFWVRRFFRIAPSACLWILVPLICSALFNKSQQFWTVPVNIRSDLAIILDLANFVGPQNLGPNPVYWSLSLEEQFYLAYPFFLLLAPIAWRWKIFVVLIAIQVIPDRSSLFYSQFWLCRLDAIMWGCVVYQFSRSPQYSNWEPKFCRRKLIALALGFGLMALLMAIPVLLEPYLKVASIVGVICAILIFLASYNKSYALPAFWPLSAVLGWIGDRSFAIYLIHIPCVSLTYEIWTQVNINRHLPPPDHSYGLIFFLTWTVLVLVLFRPELSLCRDTAAEKGCEISARDSGVLGRLYRSGGLHRPRGHGNMKRNASAASNFACDACSTRGRKGHFLRASGLC